MIQVFSIFQYLAPLGFIAVMDFFDAASFPPLFLYDKSVRQLAVDYYSDSAVWSRMIDESNGCLVGFREMKLLREKLSSIPSRIPIKLLIAGSRQYSPTFFPDAVTFTFMELLSPILTRNLLSSCRIVTETDHWIHLQQPQAVADAILELC